MAGPTAPSRRRRRRRGGHEKGGRPLEKARFSNGDAWKRVVEVASRNLLLVTCPLGG
jgi:hypothetical protein